MTDDRRALTESQTRYVRSTIPSLRRVIGSEFSSRCVALEWRTPPYTSPVLRLVHQDVDNNKIEVVSNDIVLAQADLGSWQRALVGWLLPGRHAFRLERLWTGNAFDAHRNLLCLDPNLNSGSPENWIPGDWLHLTLYAGSTVKFRNMTEEEACARIIGAPLDGDGTVAKILGPSLVFDESGSCVCTML